MMRTGSNIDARSRRIEAALHYLDSIHARSPLPDCRTWSFRNQLRQLLHRPFIGRQVRTRQLLRPNTGRSSSVGRRIFRRRKTDHRQAKSRCTDDCTHTLPLLIDEIGAHDRDRRRRLLSLCLVPCQQLALDLLLQQLNLSGGRTEHSWCIKRSGVEMVPG